MKGFSAAYGFVGAILGGAGLGYLADRALGSGPWGLLIGTMLGFAGGLYSLYTALQSRE